MMKCETVVVGAGPYGLSVSAHLRAANLDHLIIGAPMESWRAHMPARMALKSERFASNLSDPARRYTLGRFSALRGASYSPRGVPLPIGDFLDYASWFQRNAAPEIWNTRLRGLRRTSDGFELDLDDGALSVKRVILATGHLAFRHFPEALEGLGKDAPDFVSHAADHHDLSKFAGQDVVVIGCGQSALETAALLLEEGANVRVLARAPAIGWNADFETVRSLYRRLRWPESGLGDGWRSLAYSELPRLFLLLPERTRRHIVATANGPAGSWWLKDRVLDKFPLLTGHEVVEAAANGGKLLLSVRSKQTSDIVQIKADHVIAATGYRVDTRRLPFLDPALSAAVKTAAGAPVLNTAYEASVPGLHFVGLSSALTFGPVMRFVYGAKHAASALTSHIRSSSRKRSWSLRAAPADNRRSTLNTARYGDSHS